jgi:hypothetical protein
MGPKVTGNCSILSVIPAKAGHEVKLFSAIQVKPVVMKITQF